MFKDSFKKELDIIKPSDEVKSEIMRKIEEAESCRSAKITPVKRYRYAISAVAIAVCVCIALGVGWNGIKIHETNSNYTTDADTIAVQNVTYGSVYNLFKEIYDKEQKESKRTAWEHVVDGITGFFTDSVEIAVDEEESIEEDAAINNAGGAFGIDDGSKTGASTTVDTTTDSEENTGAEEYSETNTQVVGVDEGDVIKTDGRYIYVLNSEKCRVSIILADKGQMSTVGEIKWVTQIQKGQRLEEYVSEMYVKNKKVILIKYQDRFFEDDSKYYNYVITEIYDVSTPAKPVLEKSFSQSGGLISSRLSGDVLYVFSNQIFYSQKPTEKEVSTYVPTIGCDDSSDPVAQAVPVAEEDLCSFGGEIDRQYFVATSVNIKTGERIDEKSVLGGGREIYVNDSSVYSAASKCTYNYLDTDDSAVKTTADETELLRFSVSEGKLDFAASGKVDGTILNQFSMDEYNGYFRIVTTVNEYTTQAYAESATTEVATFTETRQTNALYVLNQRLEVVGKIEGLAEDERVYSVRFDGDIGYFVTFRRVDPLFTVDLSNPAAPKILSQLKIPGFSSYLHPYGKGLLLGIGNDADENTGATGNSKLSMFNVSDPTNVTEEGIEILPCEYTQASNTHKAVLVDVNKNLIGFAGSDYNTDYYYIYGYGNGGFEEKAKFLIESKLGYDVRGLYIGDYFYVCTQNSITSYTMTDFEKVEQITF